MKHVTGVEGSEGWGQLVLKSQTNNKSTKIYPLQSWMAIIWILTLWTLNSDSNVIKTSTIFVERLDGIKTVQVFLLWESQDDSGSWTESLANEKEHVYGSQTESPKLNVLHSLEDIQMTTRELPRVAVALVSVTSHT